MPRPQSPHTDEIAAQGDAIGDEFGGAHQGATNTNREAHAHREWQGAKTTKANRRIVKTGRAE